MATKHTPGPWTWRRVASDGRTVAMILETEHRPVPYNDPVVFALREDWMGELSPAREADKRLIAAAPDLLRERDALKVERDALLAALRDVMGWIDAPPQGIGERIDRDNAHDAARAAMRAATSGSGAASDVASASARATGGDK